MQSLLSRSCEIKAVQRVFFDPGMAGKGSLDYVPLLLIPIPALIAIMSHRETMKWTAAGDMRSAIAAAIDFRTTFLALVSYLLMMMIRGTYH